MSGEINHTKQGEWNRFMAVMYTCSGRLKSFLIIFQLSTGQSIKAAPASNSEFLTTPYPRYDITVTLMPLLLTVFSTWPPVKSGSGITKFLRKSTDQPTWPFDVRAKATPSLGAWSTMGIGLEFLGISLNLRLLLWYITI